MLKGTIGKAVFVLLGNIEGNSFAIVVVNAQIFVGVFCETLVPVMLGGYSILVLCFMLVILYVVGYHRRRPTLALRCATR